VIEGNFILGAAHSLFAEAFDYAVHHLSVAADCAASPARLTLANLH
jgi:hypothetical protein